MSWELPLTARAAGAVLCLAAAAAPSFAGDSRVRGAIAAGARVERVRFADPRLPAVQVVRGATHHAPLPPVPFAARVEIVSFARGGRSVEIVRGGRPQPAEALYPFAALAPAARRIETVRFSDGRYGAVTVVRGTPAGDLQTGLFGRADPAELDRIAFAVDGVESGHGAAPGMWRPDWSGPQGPMQVSAAAAFNVGGGDRFDLFENRLLGRAYLSRMFQRYGNWPDALAAYNWGPGNLDLWIAAGRPRELLPPETARYVVRVLRDTLVAGPRS